MRRGDSFEHIWYLKVRQVYPTLPENPRHEIGSSALLAQAGLVVSNLRSDHIANRQLDPTRNTPIPF